MKIKLVLLAGLVLILLSLALGSATAQDGDYRVFLPMIGRSSAQSPNDPAEIPQIKVSPEKSIPASLVWLEGSGFLNSCGINLYWDTTESDPVASAFLRKGAFDLTFTVPADAALGAHTFIAQGTDFSGEFCGGPSGEEANASFEVIADEVLMPYIVIQEIESVPGGTIHISGAGFCSPPDCSPLALWIGGVVVMDNVPVGEDGTFAIEALIPGGTPLGEITIVAVQTGAQGEMLRAFGWIDLFNRPNRPRPPVISDQNPEGPSLGAGGAPWILPGGLNSINSEQLPALALYGLVGLALVLLVVAFGRRYPRHTAMAICLLMAAAVSFAAFPLITQALAPSMVTDVNPDGLPGEPRFGGRSLGVTISPTNNQNAFVATELGGIFQSTNGGGNWAHIDQIPLTISRDVMYDPQDANIVIASGTFDGGSTNNGGIWRSTDGGANWAKPATSNPGCNNQATTWGISIPNDAAEHDNIFVATDCGLAISNDSGATWTHVDPCPAGTVGCTGNNRYYDVETRVVGGNIQVDICGDEGFFRSTNGGNNWSAPDPNSPSLTGMNPCHIATAPNDPNTVYLANWSGVNASGFCDSQLLESTGSGAAGTWVSMNVTAANCRDAWVVTSPAFSGNANDFEVYFGSSQRVLHQTCDATTTPRCTAGAASWPTADNGAHSDPSDIAFNPAVPGCPQILSTDGGISTSGDCGANWVDGNRGLHALDLVGGLAGTVEAGHTDLYFGTQDNGLYMSIDNAATWSRPKGADAYNVLADHNSPARVLYRICFGCSNGIADAHMANQAAFTDPPGTVPTTARVTQFGPDSYAMITSNGATPALWTVYVTTDEGTTWTQMGPATLPGNPGEIKSAGPAATPTFYLRLNVGGNLRIYRLSGALDNTATLVLANNGLSVPTGAWDVDPSDPTHLYVMDNGTNQVMFSTNSGATWNPDPEISNLVTRGGAYPLVTNALGAQVSAIAFDENSPRIMLGTRTAGMFASVTDGEAWVNVPGAEMLPLARDFFFDESDDAIYAGTRGRGIWRINLLEADLSITKSDLPDPAVAGENLVYSVTVTNNGPDTAYDVAFVDVLPAVVDYVTDDGTCVEAPAGTLTCNLGDLTNGASETVMITVLIHADAVFNNGGPLTITNEVDVASAIADPNLGNNTDSEDTQVLAEADLEIVSFEAVNPPAEILVGEDVQITLRKVITNNGPSAPMDTLLQLNALPPLDGEATPMLAFINQLALGLNEMRVVDEVFTIRCNGASHHIFTFTNYISPLSPFDSDPDLTNNSAMVQLDIECVVPIKINIKPGSFPNSINPENMGVVPVAILTTEAGEYGLPLAFDAATVDPLSVRFGPYDLVWSGGGGLEAHERGHMEDSYELDEKTRDGDLDMVIHSWTQETGIEWDTTVACVKGAWIDGGGATHHFFGCDSVRITPSALP
jgi:uncharacterized repeat protein (TIGR01451 family)